MNRPEEVSCSDLKYVELANRLGMSKDRCMELLGHIFQYIFGLATQGHRLEISLFGIGVLWAKSAAIGFRFHTKNDKTSMSPSKRSGAGSYAESLDLKGTSFVKGEEEEEDEVMYDDEDDEVMYDDEEPADSDRVEALLRNARDVTRLDARRPRRVKLAWSHFEPLHISHQNISKVHFPTSTLRVETQMRGYFFHTPEFPSRTRDSLFSRSTRSTLFSNSPANSLHACSTYTSRH